MADSIKLNPVTIGTEQMASITKLFADEPTGAEPIIAEQITGEVAVDYPDLINYAGLLDGTAPLFDTLPEFKDLPPEERRLSNAQIISLFAVDEQGDPIQEGSFLQGAKREIFPSVFSLAGAATGAKFGAELQAPIPPAGPLAIAAKVGIPTVTTLIGAFGGYEGGELATDALFGPEKPVTPGSRAAYEAGKTAAGAAGWLPLPFMISKNVSFGAAQYLDNLSEIFSKPGPIVLADITKPGVAGALKTGKAPKTARYTAAVERLLSGTGEAARKAPKATAFLETAAGAGAVGGAYTAETADPGDAGTRLGLEIVGSVAPSILGARLIAKGPETVASLKNIVSRARKGEFNLKGRRQNQAVQRIIDILESQGEDVDAVIERLASPEFNQILIDPDTKKPITLTAGMKADSPALLAIEASLAQTSPGLGKERSARNVQANNALRNVIAALVATGDKEALQQAAGLAEDVFSAGQSLRLTRATNRVLNAFEKVKGVSPENNMELSQRLFDSAQDVMRLGRNEERRLWNAVENQNINSFVDADGNEVAQPNFLTAWEDSMPGVKNADAPIKRKLRDLNNFIQDKKDLIAEREKIFEARRQANRTEVAPEDDLMQPLLTVKEATAMRAEALNLARQLTATGDLNAARVAHNFADGLLNDLSSLPEGDNAAYDMARAYSRSFNDTFSRAFAGRIIEKSKTGAEKVAPELLAQRLMVGGSDPTYLRVQQINDIGNFAVREGFEGASDTAATIRGTQEMILRNARAAAFDSQTGQIRPEALRKWMESNKDLLDTFPALKADLENAETANVLLRQRETMIKSKEKALSGQITFRDLLSSTTDSPTTAVARALSNGNRAPLRSLNNLNDVIKNAPEELQESAKSGLKSSVLEWAMTKGGATSRSFSPRNMYDNLFSKIPNAQSNISVMDWMVSNDLIPEREVTAVKKYLTEMVRLEAMDANGTIGELVEQAGPMLDFYLRISGSAAGGAVAKLTGDSQSLIARSAGSKYMQQIFNKVPESMKLDVMSELMENPELLAAMMRKPRNDREKVRIAERLQNMMLNLGFVPARRSAPQVLKSEEVEDLPPVPAAAPVTPTQSAVPVSQAPPAATPTPVAMVNTPPPAAPAPSGPVNRQQYAALFPNDIASGMIRQQGTALMADGGAVKHFAAGGRADGPGSESEGHSSHGFGDSNNDLGDQDRSMTVEERYRDNAERLRRMGVNTTPYVSSDQNQPMTISQRYLDNAARITPTVVTTPGEQVQAIQNNLSRADILSNIRNLSATSLANKTAPDVVSDFQNRLASGQFDKVPTNPAQARAEALRANNPTVASFAQPAPVAGPFGITTSTLNAVTTQPVGIDTLAPSGSPLSVQVGPGTFTPSYDPVTKSVMGTYQMRFARGGAVHGGIASMVRRSR